MLNEKKVVPKLPQEVKVKVDIVTSDDIKIYYTGKFQDFTARYIIIIIKRQSKLVLNIVGFFIYKKCCPVRLLQVCLISNQTTKILDLPKVKEFELEKLSLNQLMRLVLKGKQNSHVGKTIRDYLVKDYLFTKRQIFGLVEIQRNCRRQIKYLLQ